MIVGDRLARGFVRMDGMAFNVGRTSARAKRAG